MFAQMDFACCVSEGKSPPRVAHSKTNKHQALESSAPSAGAIEASHWRNQCVLIKAFRPIRPLLPLARILAKGEVIAMSTFTNTVNARADWLESWSPIKVATLIGRTDV